MTPARLRWLVVAILAIVAALDFHSIAVHSLTTDERGFYSYGRRLLFEHTGVRPEDAEFWDSKLPVSALNALPEWLCDKLRGSSIGDAILRNFDGEAQRYRWVYVGRGVTVVGSLLFSLLVLRGARVLWGDAGGLLALVVWSFCPNIRAHSQLVTADLWATGFMFLAFLAFVRWLDEPGKLSLFLAGVTIGLALAAKYTAVHLLPILVLTALCLRGRMILASLRGRDGPVLTWLCLRGLWFVLVLGAVACATLAVSYGFERWWQPLSAATWRSGALRGLAAAAGWLPMPVPYAWLQGLDQVIASDATGRSFGNLYLLGELQTGPKPGWPWYFVVVFALKSTLGSLGLLALALVLLARRGLHLVLPAAWIFVAFSLIHHGHAGLRFVLPAFPFLFVLCGGLAADARRPVRVTAWTLVAAHVASSLAMHPHHLAYMNEAIGSRINAWRYVADSNLDWGQNDRLLESWLAAHPTPRPRGVEMRGAHTAWIEFVDGSTMVSANDLVGVVGDPERFRSLREKSAPAGHVGYSYLLFPPVK